MRMIYRLMLLTSALLVVLAAPSLLTAQEEVVTVAPDGEIVVGVSLGLSGEGIAPLGTDIQRGVELANADRPTVTVGGTEFAITLDVQDSQCNAEGGQIVANRFTADDSIVGVVGPMCSSACAAAAPIYDAAGYTTISPSCTSTALTQSDFTSFNRTVPSDASQGQLAGEFLFNELGITRLATVHDGSPYGEGLVAQVEETFTELGGEVVASDAVNVGDTDFRGLLEDFANQDPEAIYFGGFPAEGARLIQQRFDTGLGDVIFMGADGIQGTEVVDLAGDDAEGIYASAPVPLEGDAYDTFLAEYSETYGEEPPAPFHANGYDAYNLLLDAIEAVGTLDDEGNLVIDRAELNEAIRSVSDASGLTGTFAADGTGELVEGGYNFFIVEDGAFTVLDMMDDME